jgi:hypothetical protein
MITNFRAFPIDRGRVLLTWQLDNKDWTKIKIVRSGEVGEKSVIGEVYKSEQFLDKNTPTVSINREVQYRLVIDETGEEIGPITIAMPKNDKVAGKIAHNNFLMLKGWGRPAAFFSAKFMSSRCDCFDPIVNRITKSNCKKCFGTGFVGGYADPVLVYFMANPKPKNSNVTELGESEKTAQMFWTDSSIYIKPRDVLVAADDSRYRITNVQVNNLRWTRTRQEMSVVDINPNDVEYDLKIPDKIINEIMEMPNRADGYLG